MSYIAYINGFEIELSDIKPIALTKQVNDIARLDNRQSNFSNKITLPFTAKNIRAMQNLFLVGNTSNVPYQKNRFDLIDAKSGKHIVYNGWCNVGQTTTKGYEINTYDGIIDFYRLIENKSLTDIGIDALNHVKDLTTIVDSWNDTEAYKYIIADYNGKLYTSALNLNADYLIPSARISYLFDRIHTFAGFTYSGNIFASEKFLNFYMTFPKPIPTTEPVTTLISNQTSEIGSYEVWYGGYGGAFFSFFVNFFPIPFSTSEANNSINANTITITTSGAFKLKSVGSVFLSGGFEQKEVNYILRAPDNSLIVSGSIDASIGQSVVINVNIGDKLYLNAGAFFSTFTGGFETTLELIDGYSVNFDDALVDFKATDFINEIMQHFGLTAFKDKYTNSIEYLTLDEILQNTNVIDDWKFISKNSEKYAYSNFAKKNNFKYKYNDNNLAYNDGAIFIQNENLKDETTIIASKFYTPEQQTTLVLSNDSNVYKFWDKEIKDDLSINYKPLSGRYYSLRSKDYDFGTTLTLESEALGTSVTFTEAPIESYFRLKQQQIIYDNYLTIGSILENARVIDASFYLTPLQYESFDFKQLLYVKELSSYYQVNKINNFIPDVPTKVELIEVDYFNELEIPDPIDYTLQINNDVPIDYTSCVATFTLLSDIPIGSTIEIIPYALTSDGLGGVIYAPYTTDEPILITYTGSTLAYNFSQLPEMPVGGYKFKFRYTISVFQIVESELSNVVNIVNSCYVPVAPTPDLSYITITDVQTLSIVGNRRNVRVSYISDLSVATMALTINAVGVTLFASLNSLSQTFPFATQNSFVDINLLNNAFTETCQYQIQLSALGVTSNIATS